ncbi:decapping and exoribonuclease protein-like isoform X2 [Ruditapes philippinarum]|uniref:decapping and exoribonuclease protein-like isoform X2 n=1 Tax=Ruditapes philippinarum TaxID=129788 RepID=UPI00295B867D|nr:decapping and exoribonuclease protein-like isoform X2 [Ruditapes philippinarum]
MCDLYLFKTEENHKVDIIKLKMENDRENPQGGVVREIKNPFFAVKKYSDFDKPSPKYGKPVEMGSYSLDINKKFIDSDVGLRYYIQPPNLQKVYFDLNHGFETRHIKERGRDINILYWIKGHMGTEEASERLDADFVTQRGLLTKLMLTPYVENENEGWYIAVTLFNGTYYLNEVESDEKKERERKTVDDIESCRGWKFEQYLTADTSNGKPNTDIPYNNCEGFYKVVKSKLKNHSLVFSGEIDAVKVDEVKGNSYVEFKTTKEIRMGQRYLRNFQRYKTKHWWVQSYLTGTKEIVCGFKDKNGIVNRVHTFKRADMLIIAKDAREPWKPNVCFNYLDLFLSTVKSKITHDDYRIVYTLKWNPHKPVMISPPLRDSEFNFLPEWYVAWKQTAEGARVHVSP